MSKRKGVAALFIHYNGIPVRFMGSIVASIKAGAIGDFYAASSSRTNAARTENGVNFLESDYEWALYVDTDMTWDPSDVIRLKQFAESKGPGMYAATAYMPKNGIWANAFRFQEPASYLPWGEIDPFSDPLRVDAVGGSSFLVHRKVLEDVREMTRGRTSYFWQDEPYYPENDLNRGEDVEFSHRVRQAGYEIWYHPDIFFIHWKEQPIGPAQYTQFIGHLRQRAGLTQVRNKLHIPGVG